MSAGVRRTQYLSGFFDAPIRVARGLHTLLVLPNKKRNNTQET